MRALSDAFNRAGVSPALTELRVALSKFINQGGSCAQIRAEIDAIERMPGMGHDIRDGEAIHRTIAQTRQPVEDGGAIIGVPHGRRLPAPSSSSDRGGEGHMISAPLRQTARALPVREPSSAYRAAAATIAKVIAVTVLDTTKIDGRSIGDWTVGEARNAGRLKSREGYILIEASRTVANAPANALLRSVVKVSELQTILQKAAEVADAV